MIVIKIIILQMLYLLVIVVLDYASAIQIVLCIIALESVVENV